MKKETLNVIFRYVTYPHTGNSHLVAIFEELENPYERFLVSETEHGLSGCDYHYVLKNSRPATEEEYSEHLKDLRQRYEKEDVLIKVQKRINWNNISKQRKNLLES